MNRYFALAAFLVVAWVVLRLVLAVTGLFLNLLWLAAIVFLAIGIFRLIKR